MDATNRGRVRVEPTAKRVRTYLGGRVVADTTSALLVWEVPYYPTFYFPLDDVDEAALKATGATRHSPSRGEAVLYTVTSGTAEAADAALAYPDSPLEQIRGYVRFEWDAMDAWFEEDEEVFVHPRNPYARVDALRSSRRVRIELNGIVLAESSSPVLLFETGLPTRYYLPRTDVRFEHLTPSDTRTQCPYKGRTSGYWSAAGAPDVAWSYDFPAAAVLPIAGLVAFLDEAVDVVLDGVRQERPVTHFSR
jgi:uncharacterized protein (DUF427 family)